MIPVFAAPSPQLARTLGFVREVPKQSNRIFLVDSPVTTGFSMGKIMTHLLKHSHLDVAIICHHRWSSISKYDFPSHKLLFIYNDMFHIFSTYPKSTVDIIFPANPRTATLFTSFFSSSRNGNGNGVRAAYLWPAGSPVEAES